MMIWLTMIHNLNTLIYSLKFKSQIMIFTMGAKKPSRHLYGYACVCMHIHHYGWIVFSAHKGDFATDTTPSKSGQSAKGIYRIDSDWW